MARPEDAENPFSKLAGFTNNDDELTKHLEFRAVCDELPNGPPLCYDTLRSNRHIRLLTLHPGKLEDVIRCELKTVELDSSETEYAALSYTWGDLIQRLPIQCGGATALITINLYSALLRLRSPIEKQILWIDALCINQSSDPNSSKERADQVKMMGQIYSLAAKVIVDLGGVGGEQTKALSIFLAYAELEIFGTTRWAQVLNGRPDLNTVFWIGFQDFISRPWFRRVWVIQEFVLARQIEMRIGPLTVSLQVLWRFVDTGLAFLRGTDHLDEALMKMFSSKLSHLPDIAKWVNIVGNIHSMLHTRRDRQESSTKVPFSVVLDLGVRCETTRRRDRIYGVLGLIEDGIGSQISVDYSESDDQFEERVGRVMLSSNLATECLWRAKGVDAVGRSWAPSILCPTAGKIVATSFGKRHSGFYKACGTENSRQCVRFTGKKLFMIGVHIDTIEPSSDANPTSLGFTNFLEAQINLIQWYKNVIFWADQHFESLQDTTRHRTLWRTFTWDQFEVMHGRHRRFANTTEVDYDRKSFEIMFQQFLASNDLSGFKEFSVSETAVPFWPLGKICRTIRGRMANIPEGATRGDEIWILQGVQVPAVLRRTDSGHVFVGLCYVHGMMDGQGLKIPGRKFEIVCIH